MFINGNCDSEVKRRLTKLADGTNSLLLGYQQWSLPRDKPMNYLVS